MMLLALATGWLFGVACCVAGLLWIATAGLRGPRRRRR